MNVHQLISNPQPQLQIRPTHSFILKIKLAAQSLKTKISSQLIFPHLLFLFLIYLTASLQLYLAYEQFIVLSYLFFAINIEWVLFFVFDRHAYAKGSQHYVILWGINIVHVAGMQIKAEWEILGVLVEGALVYAFFLYGNKYFDENDLILAGPLLFLYFYLGQGIQILVYGCISYGVRNYAPYLSPEKQSKQRLLKNTMLVLSMSHCVLFKLTDPLNFWFMPLLLGVLSSIVTDDHGQPATLKKSHLHQITIYSLILGSSFFYYYFGFSTAIFMNNLVITLQILFILYAAIILTLQINQTNEFLFLSTVLFPQYKPPPFSMHSDTLYKNILIQYALTLSFLILFTQQLLTLFGFSYTPYFQLLIVLLSITYYKLHGKLNLTKYLTRWFILLFLIALMGLKYGQSNDQSVLIKMKKIYRCDERSVQIGLSLVLGMTGICVKWIYARKQERIVYNMGIILLSVSMLVVWVNQECVLSLSAWLYMLAIFYFI